MDKTIIVYQTKYGMTKQYAQWIAEKTGADIAARKDAKLKDVLGYDTIVYGGCVFLGSIKGLSFVKNAYEQLKKKKLFVFAVGGTPPEADKIETMRQKNFSPEMLADDLPLALLPGVIQTDKLGGMHGMMLGNIRRMMEKKQPEELTDGDREFLAMFDEKTAEIDEEAAGVLAEEIGK